MRVEELRTMETEDITYLSIEFWVLAKDRSTDR